MMISPEAYYEEYLQGKSQSAILQQISLLKREIDRLKEVMESDENSPESMVMPSPLTRIKCNREYLEMAKLAFEEAGGQYELTDEDLRDQSFIQSWQLCTGLPWRSAGSSMAIRNTNTPYPETTSYSMRIIAFILSRQIFRYMSRFPEKNLSGALQIFILESGKKGMRIYACLTEHSGAYPLNMRTVRNHSKYVAAMHIPITSRN